MRDERGFALVLTLMILVLITALVTEFSYGVFTTTSALNNWKESQRLSFVARSGVTLAVKTIIDFQSLSPYTYPDRIEIPVEDILGGFTGRVIVTVEDETSRFNLNSLRNPHSLDAFKRLTQNLGLKEDIADRIANWLDLGNSDPRISDPRKGTKHAFLDSTDELLEIKGIDSETFSKLLPYVTVFGRSDNVSININTASLPVIMSLNVGSSEAQRIIQERERKPFADISSDFIHRVGKDIGPPLQQNLDVKSSRFRIKVIAEENQIKRVIESVVAISGQTTIEYWKEM